LNKAETLADFHTLGNCPSAKDLFISSVRTGAMTSEASFNRRALSLSRPTAFFVFRDLRAFCTKLHETVA